MHELQLSLIDNANRYITVIEVLIVLQHFGDKYDHRTERKAYLLCRVYH